MKSKKRCKVVLQTTATDCALACLATVLDAYGASVTLDALRVRIAAQYSGVSVRRLVQAAASYNIAARPVRPTMESISGIRLPAILHWDFNHFVVLERIEKNKFYVIDPSRGRRIYSKEDVSNHFTGIGIEFTPLVTFKKINHIVRTSMTDLWSTLNGVFSSLGMALATSVLVQLLVLIAPIFMAVIINNAVKASDLSLALVLLGAMGAAQLLALFGDLMRRLILLKVGTQLVEQVNLNIVNHLLKLPYEFFQQRRFNDLLARIESTSALKNFMIEGAVPSVIDGVFSILTCLAIALLYWPAAILMLAMWVIHIIIKAATYPELRRRVDDTIDRHSQERGILMETIQGVLTVKAINADGVRLAAWNGANRATLDVSRRMQALRSVLGVSERGINAVDLIVVIGICVVAVTAKNLSLGSLFAIITLRQQFQERAYPLIDKASELGLVKRKLERLGDITLQHPENGDDGSEVQRGVIVHNGRLQVEDLQFRYSEDASLIADHITLDVNDTETIVITGRSGVGKTTLMMMMAGLVNPTGGEIYIDGKKLIPAVKKAYREQIACVLQGDKLFSGTLADNICGFDINPREEAICNAAKLACIHDEIITMPMGYFSLVGDMGSSLSGGQKQRILIARALYRNPKILFLDEGTQNIDPSTEVRIINNLKQLGITIISVAHRSAILQIADRIFTMENGRLRELRRKPVELTEAPVA